MSKRQKQPESEVLSKLYLELGGLLPDTVVTAREAKLKERIDFLEQQIVIKEDWASSLWLLHYKQIKKLESHLREAGWARCGGSFSEWKPTVDNGCCKCRLDELTDALADMVMQHCTEGSDFGYVDAGFIRANATAIRLLGKLGRVDIDLDAGEQYRVVSGRLKEGV